MSFLRLPRGHRWPRIAAVWRSEVGDYLPTRSGRTGERKVSGRISIQLERVMDSVPSAASECQRGSCARIGRCAHGRLPRTVIGQTEVARDIRRRNGGAGQVAHPVHVLLV
jgi:hypothetical protein